MPVPSPTFRAFRGSARSSDSGFAMAAIDPTRLLKLERGIRRRLDARVALRRMVASVPAAVQIVVAVVAAYSFARFVVGHEMPLVAVAVTISTLGFARDARPRRVLETVIGILIGIALAEVLLLLVGTGVWQVGVVLLATLLVARLVSPSNAFAIAAGVQSMLVLLVPAPEGGVFVRSIDGLIGGVFALLVTALIPRDPRKIARDDTRTLVLIISEAVDTVVTALQRADESAAHLALERLRRTQAVIDDATESLDTARAVARISPFLRKHVPALNRQAALNTGLDLASRHLRLITRRIEFLVSDGTARPELAGLLDRVGAAIAKLPDSRAELATLARELDPEVVLPDAEVTDAILVHLLRPLVVDLLVATGMPIDEARALLPEV